MAQTVGSADKDRERMRIPAAPLRERFGPGLIGSGLLHLLGILAALLFMPHLGGHAPETALPPVIPVNIIQLGPETIAPPAQHKALVPQQAAIRAPRHAASSPRRPHAAALHKAHPPTDELETKLAKLSRLLQPESDLHINTDVGTSNVTATSNGAKTGRWAAYSMRDFIRAQVERRWSLNVSLLGNKDFSVLVHVVMKRDGTVTLAEIVDKKRFVTDKAYHEVALSARNAVIMSSPFALPPGNYDATMDMTLTLNPHDTLR
jgi:hypothetical protein